MTFCSKRAYLSGVLGILTTLSLFFFAQIPAEAAKKKEAETTPTYAASGSIPGTQLEYENLTINKHGIVAITINNPTSTGVSFSSNFTFYDAKGKYVAGFTLSGFASARTRKGHMIQMKDYGNLKKIASLKVLGRSGRSVE